METGPSAGAFAYQRYWPGRRVSDCIEGSAEAAGADTACAAAALGTGISGTATGAGARISCAAAAASGQDKAIRPSARARPNIVATQGIQNSKLTRAPFIERGTMRKLT